MSQNNEARTQLEGLLFRISRGELGGDNAVRDIASTLLSLIQDVETQLERTEAVVFEMVQRLEIAERRLHALPPADDLEDMRTLVLGNERIQMKGLQQSMRTMESILEEMQQKLWTMLIIQGGIFGMFVLAVGGWMVVYAK